MKKESDAYFTVEAAILYPIILSVILLMTYLLLFQYYRCLLEQVIGKATVLSGSKWTLTKEQLNDYMQKKALHFDEEKYIAWENEDPLWKLEKNDVILDFMMVSSYGMSTKSSGVVKIIKDVDAVVEGQNVLIVEDIIDTGLTMNYLRDYFQRKGCKSFKICTLLDKPQRRTCDVVADFTGFEIPDKFVVGYGIDCGEKYRNLPYIGYVEE